MNNDDVQSETKTDGFHLRVNKDLNGHKFLNLDKVGYYIADDTIKKDIYTWYAGVHTHHVNVFGDDYYGIIYSNKNMAGYQMLNKGRTDIYDGRLKDMIGIYIGKYSHKVERKATITD